MLFAVVREMLMSYFCNFTLLSFSGSSWIWMASAVIMLPWILCCLEWILLTCFYSSCLSKTQYIASACVTTSRRRLTVCKLSSVRVLSNLWWTQLIVKWRYSSGDFSNERTCHLVNSLLFTVALGAFYLLVSRRGSTSSFLTSYIIHSSHSQLGGSFNWWLNRCCQFRHYNQVG